MAVGKIETTLVLSAIGIAMVAGAYGILPAMHFQEAAAEDNSTARPIPDSAKSAKISALPETFIATVENEDAWRPDILPSAWPQFTKLPGEKPLPPKPTRFKIDNAKSVLSKWQRYQSGQAKDLPSAEESGLGARYLLSIERSDPLFPEAWATFIRFRQANREMSRESAMASARELVESERRNAKKRGVYVGMTAEQIIASSWGKPQSVNVTITAGGRHEQWVYAGFQYLYVDNGTLTSIQTSRK